MKTIKAWALVWDYDNEFATTSGPKDTEPLCIFLRKKDALLIKGGREKFRVIKVEITIND